MAFLPTRTGNDPPYNQYNPFRNIIPHDYSQNTQIATVTQKMPKNSKTLKNRFGSGNKFLFLHSKQLWICETTFGTGVIFVLLCFPHKLSYLQDFCWNQQRPSVCFMLLLVAKAKFNECLWVLITLVTSKPEMSQAWLIIPLLPSTINAAL